MKHDADGVKGEAFQCDLCESWFHALCENIGSSVSDRLTTIARTLQCIFVLERPIIIQFSLITSSDLGLSRDKF